MKFTITKRIIGIRFLKLGLDDSCYYEKLSYATKHIIHKICYKARRKEENMTIYLIYKKKHLVTSKEEGINVYDLGYLGVETDFPEQLSSNPNRKKRNIDLHKKKNSITKFILKKSDGSHYL